MNISTGNKLNFLCDVTCEDNFLFKSNKIDIQWNLTVLQRDFILIYRCYSRLKPTSQQQPSGLVFQHSKYNSKGWNMQSLPHKYKGSVFWWDENKRNSGQVAAPYISALQVTICVPNWSAMKDVTTHFLFSFWSI